MSEREPGRPDGRSRDDGQVMILTLGFVVVALLLITVVVSAAGVHLERKRLLALADLLALEAADAVGDDQYFAPGAGRRPGDRRRPADRRVGPRVRRPLPARQPGRRRRVGRVRGPRRDDARRPVRAGAPGRGGPAGADQLGARAVVRRDRARGRVGRAGLVTRDPQHNSRHFCSTLGRGRSAPYCAATRHPPESHHVPCPGPRCRPPRTSRCSRRRRPPARTCSTSAPAPGRSTVRSAPRSRSRARGRGPGSCGRRPSWVSPWCRGVRDRPRPGVRSRTTQLVVSTDRLDRILEVSPARRDRRRRAGRRQRRPQRHLEQYGLFYAPGPGQLDISTIGGNIATNAGGLRCAKYGVTRESVLALDVVLADGA